MKTLDCRGMACPMPVVTVKRALAGMPNEEALEVLLDQGAPVENVIRFATGRGYQVANRSTKEGAALVIAGGDAGSSSLKAGSQLSPAGQPLSLPKAGERVVLVTSDRFGDGPEELGRLLMKNYIITLLDMEEPPDRIFFLNTGVHLTTEGSEVLDALAELGNRGVEVLSCGICLDFFHRKDRLKAGTVTNMFTIAESLQRAVSVIRL